MMKRILDNDLDTKPKGNKILENSLISHDVILSFLFENEGFEKWEAKIIDNEYYHPEKVSTKSELRFLNKFIANTLKNDFKTNLNDEQRKALCDEIISNDGSYNDKMANGKQYKIKTFVDLEEKHKPTLMYLLGGTKPDKIDKIKMTTHQKVYDLLYQYSTHTNIKGEKCLPDFLTKSKNNICSKTLLNSKGGEITKLNNPV